MDGIFAFLAGVAYALFLFVAVIAGTLKGGAHDPVFMLMIAAVAIAGFSRLRLRAVFLLVVALLLFRVLLLANNYSLAGIDFLAVAALRIAVYAVIFCGAALAARGLRRVIIREEAA